MIADYLRGPGPLAGYLQGRNQDFKLRGGGAVKQILGVFRVKNHDFTQKNHIFSNFRGGRAGCALPPGSAPDLQFYFCECLYR